MEKVYTKIVFIFLAVLIITQSFPYSFSQFICNPPEAVYLNHTSVDPPTFQWVPITGNPWWCAGVVGRYSFPCPYNGGMSVQIFSAELNDSCYNMPYSVWSGIQANTEMCWALESGIGPHGVSTGGRYLRLVPELPYITNYYPPSGAANVELTTLFKWNKCEGATNYYVRIYDSRRLNNVIYEGNSTSDSLRIPAGWIQNSRTYWWRIKPYNSTGSAPISDPYIFYTVEASQLPAPVLYYPLYGAEKVALTTSLDWSNVTGAVQYRVQLSASPDFTSNIIDETSLAVSNYNIPSGLLAKNTIYYWRASASDGAIWSPYTTTWNFTTLGLPSPVILNNPANNTIDASTNQIFNWFKPYENSSQILNIKSISGRNRGSNSIDAVTNYKFELTSDTVLLTGIISDSLLTDTLKTINGLATGTKYYWRVKAKNEMGWGSYSYWWSFTTTPIPSPVLQAYPLNNSVNQPTDISFTWYKGNGSGIMQHSIAGLLNKNNNIFASRENKLGTDAIDKYWFEINTDTVLLTGQVTDSTLTDTIKIINGFSFSTSYYWRVKAHNDQGWGSFSPWWKFTTTNGAPVLESPANNQTEVTVTPLLNWSDVSGGVKYRLQISALSNFSVLWIDDSNLTSSQYQVPNGILAYNSLYYWRVKTKNNTGWGSYQSPIRFFTQVIPPPSAPVLVSPANGASGVSLTTVLDWNDVSGSTKYRVQVSTENGFNTLLIDDSTFTVSQFSVPAGILTGNSQYFWRAAVKGSASWSVFSGIWNFNTIGVPLPVVLSYPSDNSTEQPVDITFKWFKANEMLSIKLSKVTAKINSGKSGILSNGTDAISSYWFEMTTDTNSLAGLLKDSALTDTLKSVTGLNVNTKYFWRVKAKNSSGWGAYSLWWKFTTVSNLPPVPPVLVSPVNNAQNISVTPLIDWNDVNGASQYRLQVSALSSFSVLWIDDSNLTASQYQVLNGVLAYNSLYYWRVKARNSIGWGNYQTSVYRFFTLLIPPPSTPVPVLPVNGATGVSLTPLFDWNDVSGITKYRVQIAADTGFTIKITDDSSIVTSQYNIPAGMLTNSTVYYWKVTAKNSLYWSQPSVTFSFKTFGNPQNVILVSPANNSIEQPLNITFTWKKALETLDKNSNKMNFSGSIKGNIIFGENDGTDAISKYWFELTTDTSSLSGLQIDSVLIDTLKNVTSLTGNTGYYWHVKAKNEVGWGAFSQWWKFTTVSGLPPAPPVLIYPSNRAPDISVTPLLDWNDAAGAQKYRIQVSALSSFSTLWIDDSNITASEYQVGNGILAYNSGYFWRVKAKNDAGWGNYQAVLFRFFTLVTPPQAPPVLVSPVNNSVNISLIPVLDWSDITGAVKYRLQVSTNSGFGSLIVDDSNSVSSQYSVSAGVLNYNTAYYWRTAVKTGSVWSAFSSAWNFTTVTALSAPALSTPVNKDTGVAVTPNFTWSKITGASGYRLQVSAFSNFSVLWIDKYVSDTSYQTPNGVLAYNSRYFWRVKSLRALDSSSYSNANYFFTKLFAYSAGKPEMETEKYLDLTGLISNDKKMNYSLEICRDTLFTEIVMKTDNIKEEFIKLQLNQFDEFSTYFWRVSNGNVNERSIPVQVFVTYNTKYTDMRPVPLNSVIPDKYTLYQNYPNPFNPECRIKFDIPNTNNMKADNVKITLYDLVGREVAVLINAQLVPGTYEVSWNAASYPSGIYVYQIKTNLFSDTKKMVLLK